MKHLISLFTVLFVSLPSFAYFIEGTSYDPATMTLFVDVVFEGGEKEHHFDAIYEPCFYNENPNGLAIRITDTGWNDTGKDIMGRRIHVDLSMQQHCLPANVTVFLGHEHDTIFVE